MGWEGRVVLHQVHSVCFPDYTGNNVVTEISPFFGFIGRHACPEKVDMVGEKAGRKWAGEGSKYGDGAEA